MLGSSEIAESGVKVSSRILRRYVLRGEQVEVATRQHWAKLAEPVITVILGFFLVAWTSAGLERAFGDFGLYLWWVWFGLIGRLVWRVFEWRNEWFVATDKRLLLTYGLFTHKVAMMPLGKVTDLNYGRSVSGRMLGYGDFTLESAGQDQALRKINWLPSPDETYRRICDIIFGPERFDTEDHLGHHHDPSTPESEQTDFDHRPPAHPEPPRQRYTSDKIAAKGDGGSSENWDQRHDSDTDALDDYGRPTGDVDGAETDRPDIDDDTDQDGHFAAEQPPDSDDDKVEIAEPDDGESSADEFDPPHVDRVDIDRPEGDRPEGDQPEGDQPDRDVSDEVDDDWVIDGGASAWDSTSGGADESWQTSREGPPSYQRVQPRPRGAADDDITGPIRPR